MAIAEAPPVTAPPPGPPCGAGRFRSWTPDQRALVLRGALEAVASVQSLVCDLAAACDEARDWEADGAVSMSSWLVEAGALGAASARRYVRVGRRLQDLPSIGLRFATGAVSFDQVEPVTRVATDETEQAIAAALPGWSAATCAQLAAEARTRTRAESRRTHDDRFVAFTDDPESGGGHLRGFLGADQYATVRNELTRLAEQAGANPQTGQWDPEGVRLADALVDLCDASTGTRQPQDATVVVHVDDDVLAGVRAGNGVLDRLPVGLDTIYRLACDAHVEHSIEGVDGTTVGIGRRSRQVPHWLRRQVVERDGTCRRTGCGRTIRHAHHIQHWTSEGPTNLDNLIGLCWHCHHLVHEGGWTITGNPNHEVVFHHPNGLKQVRSGPGRPRRPTRRLLADP